MIHQVWRLGEAGPDNLGLACTDDGLLLGHTTLIERRDGRFVVRERSDIERLLRRAYQTDPPVGRLMSGLATVAAALNANDPLLFGGGLFWSYMFLYLAGLITAIVMLRSRLFGRWLAGFGIAASMFGLGYFVTSAFAPALGIIPAVGSAPCNLVWYLLTGLALLRAGRRPTR